MPGTLRWPPWPHRQHHVESPPSSAHCPTGLGSYKFLLTPSPSLFPVTSISTKLLAVSWTHKVVLYPSLPVILFRPFALNLENTLFLCGGVADKSSFITLPSREGHSNINSYIWNLGQYQWSYMHGSKGDTAKETQTFGLSGRRQEWDDLRECTETCTLPYVKQMTCPSSMHKAGYPKSAFWDSPGGWGGEGGGRGFRTWSTCTPVASSCWCMAKTSTIL